MQPECEEVLLREERGNDAWNLLAETDEEIKHLKGTAIPEAMADPPSQDPTICQLDNGPVEMAEEPLHHPGVHKRTRKEGVDGEHSDRSVERPVLERGSLHVGPRRERTPRWPYQCGRERGVHPERGGRYVEPGRASDPHVEAANLSAPDLTDRDVIDVASALKREHGRGHEVHGQTERLLHLMRQGIAEPPSRTALG
jgi:hypothetical protein